MNLKKIKQLYLELAQLPTITEKLNFYKTNYLDKYPGDLLWKYFEMQTAKEKGKKLGDAFWGELRIPVTEKKLIPVLHDPSFKFPQKYRIEYYYWMLYFVAEKLFKDYYKPLYEREIKQPRGINFIKGELEKLKRIRLNAEKSLKTGLINLNNGDNLTNEKLYLWYINDIYSQIEIHAEDKDNLHVINICKHHYVFPFLNELLKSSQKGGKPGILKLIGIDIEKLVSELLKRGYIDGDDQVRMRNWLKGIHLKSAININKPMNHFASLVASLQENNHIKNTKTFCCTLIQKSFLFHNETVSFNSINNSMKKKDPTRIKIEDKENYIDIQKFVYKS
jgi:hypothetical protein